MCPPGPFGRTPFYQRGKATAEVGGAEAAGASRRPRGGRKTGLLQGVWPSVTLLRSHFSRAVFCGLLSGVCAAPRRHPSTQLSRSPLVTPPSCPRAQRQPGRSRSRPGVCGSSPAELLRSRGSGASRDIGVTL